MPDTVSLDDLTRRPITNEDGTHMLSYELHGYPLGTAMIINQVAQDTSDLYVASGNSLSDVLQTKPFHEIKIWLVACMLAVIILIILLVVFLIHYNKMNKSKHPTPPNHQYRMQ